MSFQRTLATEEAVRALRVTLYGSCVALSLVSLWLVGSWVYNEYGKSQLEGTIAQRKKSITEIQAAVNAAENAPAEDAPEGMAAVAKFQSFVDSIAPQQGCSLEEFKSASDIVPYLSSFRKDASPGEWGQVRVELTLTGSASGIVDTLRRFKDVEVPVEFDHVDLHRASIDKFGHAGLTAQVELRVLVHQEAA